MTDILIPADSSTEPARCSLREQKKQQTRAAIHRAARDLVLGSGLHAVTIDEICAEAGVSSRTFFNYYPSKVTAALGLPELHVTEQQRHAFASSEQPNVVRALCDVMAEVLLAASPTGARESIQDLIRAQPELRVEVGRWLTATRAEFIALATERLPKHRAMGAVALVITAVAEAIDEGGRPGADLADRLWDGVTAMAALVTGPTSAP